MILIDTDILSALAKIARLPLLFALLQTTRLHITPGVFGELMYSFNLKRQYAADVFALIVADQLQLVYLTQEEARFRNTLPATLGAGERVRDRGTARSGDEGYGHRFRERGWHRCVDGCWGRDLLG